MPCNNGIRETIDESKAYYIKERELDRTDPARLFWKTLVSRVCGTSGGLQSLSDPERKYFAAHVLLGEIYNGGFEQFFINHSGEYYNVALQALEELEAQHSLRLLRQAKEVLFADDDVPLHTPTRRTYLATHPNFSDEMLDALDEEFWSDPDALYEKLEVFAQHHRLFGVAV